MSAGAEPRSLSFMGKTDIFEADPPLLATQAAPHVNIALDPSIEARHDAKKAQTPFFLASV